MVAFQYLGKLPAGILENVHIPGIIHFYQDKSQKIISGGTGINPDRIFFYHICLLQLTDAFGDCRHGKRYLFTDIGGACAAVFL